MPDEFLDLFKFEFQPSFNGTIHKLHHANFNCKEKIGATNERFICS